MCLLTLSRIYLLNIFFTIDVAINSDYPFSFLYSWINTDCSKFIPLGEVKLNSLVTLLLLIGDKIMSFLFVFLSTFTSVDLIFFYLGSSFFTLLLIYFAIYLIFPSRSFISTTTFGSFSFYGLGTRTFSFGFEILFLIVTLFSYEICFFLTWLTVSLAFYWTLSNLTSDKSTSLFSGLTSFLL